MNLIKLSANPFGKYFISYRRSKSPAISLLVQVLREHGLPVWLDIRDLENEPTAEAVQGAIRDPETAGAVLFMSEDVADSQMIRIIEAPSIIARLKQDENFFVTLVLADGLDYADAGKLYGPNIGLTDLSNWNLSKVAKDFSLEDARTIANDILRRRLQTIAKQATCETRLVLNTRVPPASALHETAVVMDWSQAFGPRHCSPLVWEARLLPALQDVTVAVGTHLANRRVIASGLLGIPAAISLGAAFSATQGIKIGWEQRSPKAATTSVWQLDCPEEPIDFGVHHEARDLTAEDLYIAISITADTSKDVAATIAEWPIRATIDFHLKSFSNSLTAGNAAYLAFRIADELRKARNQYQSKGSVHIFMAGPVGLGMLIGQLLNTFGTITTYEYEMAAKPPYIPAATFQIA